MPSEAPRRRLRVNIVAWEQGGGLMTDVRVLSGLLTRLGCRVRFNGHATRQRRWQAHRILRGVGLRLRHGYSSIGAGPIYDVNLFLESIDAKFIPHARVNAFVPNPEWFRDENAAYLSRMDLVLCKTRDAVETFRPLASDVRYVGFTSLDRLDRTSSQSGELLCLHTAGASRWKGTAAVVEAWRRHPEWPHLILVQSPRTYRGDPPPPHPNAPNITYVVERLDETALKRYQNKCAVHVCPSEAEGFGHILVEAMSCGAVVITTDGPPMNEIVTRDRGVLVRPARSEPMRLGTAYYVDVDDLESQIGRVLTMDPAERFGLGGNARAWYEGQSAAFARALEALVDEVRSADVPVA